MREQLNEQRAEREQNEQGRKMEKTINMQRQDIYQEMRKLVDMEKQSFETNPEFEFARMERDRLRRGEEQTRNIQTQEIKPIVKDAAYALQELRRLGRECPVFTPEDPEWDFMRQEAREQRYNRWEQWINMQR